MVANEISMDDGDVLAEEDHSSKLPMEVLIYIVQFLNHSDRKCIRLVNRRWHEASSLRLYLKKDVVKIREKVLEVGKPPLSIIMNSSRPFYCFSFAMLDLNMKVKKFWKQMGSKISFLRFYQCSMSYKYLSFILSSCPNLKHLEVSYCGDLFDPMEQQLNQTHFSRTLPQLKLLRMVGNGFCAHGFMALFDRIVSNAPILEDVTFNYFGSIDAYRPDSFRGPDFYKIMKSVMKRKATIKSINFYCNVSNKSLKFTKLVPELNLTKFSLISCNDWTNAVILPVIQHQTNLQILDLSSYSSLCNKTLVKICDNLKFLKELKLRSCTSISDWGVSNLSKLVHLEVLDLSYCFDVPSSAITKALCSKENKLLKWLSLASLEKLNEQTIIKMSECLPNLIHLDLSGCRNAVTDPALQAIIQRQIWIQVLNLCECDKLSDTGLTSLVKVTVHSPRDNLKDENCSINAEEKSTANEPCSSQGDIEKNSLSRLKGLRELYLNKCQNITDMSLKFAVKFLELQKLYLEDCPKITDEGLRFVGKQNPSLEEISFCECKNITDKGVLNLLQPLHRVKILDLRDCNQITKKSSAVIFTHCKTLQRLFIKGAYF